MQTTYNYNNHMNKTQTLELLHAIEFDLIVFTVRIHGVQCSIQAFKL